MSTDTASLGSAPDGTTSSGDDGHAPVLVVDDLQVMYETTAGNLPAVDHVSFSLQPGQRMGLIGESGSGKTTMATALMRMTKPPGKIIGGRVLLSGVDLLAMTDEDLRQTRLRDIALVPQGAMNSLNPVMRIEDQMIDGIVAHEGNKSKSELAERVEAQLAKVGLPPEVARRHPHELSGGMKQRAVMAISTSLEPKVIIADEPTSALDVVVQRQVMQTLGRLQEGLGSAVVLIGHDMGLMVQFADLIGVMYAGRLVEVATVGEIITDPRHPYTRLLVESLPKLTAKGRLVGIPGLPPPLLALPPGCSFEPRCPYAFESCHEAPPPLIEVGPGRRTACHLYPEHDVLPPLPQSVELDPNESLQETSHHMEGREEPGRAAAEIAMGDAALEPGRVDRGEMVDPARRAGDLAQADQDEGTGTPGHRL